MTGIVCFFGKTRAEKDNSEMEPAGDYTIKKEGVEERKSWRRRSRMSMVSNGLFSASPGCRSCCRRPVEQRVDGRGVAGKQRSVSRSSRGVEKQHGNPSEQNPPTLTIYVRNIPFDA